MLTDHLGSTSLITDSAGNVLSETRYTAWGEVRYQSGSEGTKYQFTGQYSYASDFGLLYFNARWVDPVLGRFAQADTIVPAGVQGYDRYAFVNNNPVRYTDPSGHAPSCDDWDDCDGEVSGCSVSTGSFNGSFTCTPDDLNAATIEQRRDWFNSMLESEDPDYVQEFTNINGILVIFTATNTGTPGTWASWGDAGILASIQNGLAMSVEKKLYSGIVCSS